MPPSHPGSAAVPIRPLVLALLLVLALAVGSLAAVGSIGSPAQAGSTRPAIVVSPRGDDSARGTAGSPLRSIQAAIDQASAGDTVVVRGGTYHESVTIPAGKRVTLTAAPGERVWLDGAQTVSSWQASGGARKRASRTVSRAREVGLDHTVPIGRRSARMASPMAWAEARPTASSWRSRAPFDGSVSAALGGFSGACA